MGTEQDFTEGSLNRAIFILAVPMVLEMVMESLFGIVDIFFVARLGSSQVAVVGITESMLCLIFAVAVGLSTATTATVSRRIGEKNREAAARAAVQSMILSTLVALPLGIAGFLYAPELLRLMGASHETVIVGSGYSALILGSNMVIVWLFVLNAVFRGAGDAAISMRVLWLANGINILLDPCLMFGYGFFPELGIMGAAVATTIGRSIGIIYQLYVLFGGSSRISLSLKYIRIDRAIMMGLARIAAGGVVQYLIPTASWLALVRIIAIFGSSALAGYTVGLRIIIFAILPAWGISNAAATLVGQNLGAHKPDRAERAAWKTGFFSMVFLGLVAILFLYTAEPVIRMFTKDPEVIPFGIDCLKFLSYGNVFYAYGMVMVQAFNGAGDTYTPTWIYLFCYWLFQVPLSFLLGIRIGWGPVGVFSGILISESVLAVISIFLFKRGTWKTRRV